MRSFVIYLILVSFTIIVSSCESESERIERAYAEEQRRIEHAALQKQREETEAREHQEREAARAIQEELERRERELYNQYINNSLHNGSTPYAYCYGSRNSYASNGSEINVTTPYNSDVVVIIKKNNSVYRHAYIKAGSIYTFYLSNGTFQPFFYYGKGWNPNKFMKETACGRLTGGFISEELFGKDSPQYLRNQILSYELILQSDGNFSTTPSSPNEAF